MNTASQKTIAELRAMRASGEIDAEDYRLAKKYLADEIKNLGHATVASKVERPKPGMRKTLLWIFIGLAALSWLVPHHETSGDANVKASRVSAPPTGVKVVATVYGDDWPYPPFDSGVLQCRREVFGQSGGYHLDRPAVTIVLGGTEYGLNGAALNAGYADPRPLMPTDEYGIFKGRIPTIVDKFLQIGMARCGS